MVAAVGRVVLGTALVPELVEFELAGSELVGALAVVGNSVGGTGVELRGLEGFSESSCWPAVSDLLFTPQE